MSYKRFFGFDRKNILAVTGIIILIFGFFMSISNIIKLGACMILLIYICLYLLYGKVLSYVNHLVPLILNILFALKYCVYPIIVLFSTTYVKYLELYFGSGKEVYAEYGTLFAIWEELFVGIFIIKKFKVWYKNDRMYMIEAQNIEIYKSNAIIYIAFLIGIILHFRNPIVFYSNYNNIIDLLRGKVSANQIAALHAEDTSVLSETLILFFLQMIYVLVPVIIFIMFYKRYIRSGRNNLFYYISLFFCMIPCVVIMNRTSRARMVVPLIALLFLFFMIYKENRKKTVMIMGTGIVFIFVLLTLWKQFHFMVSGNISVTFDDIALTIDSYSQGIRNMGIAVEGYYNSGILASLKYFINDTLSGLMYFYRFADRTSTSRIWFDIICGRNDQVIPASGQGLYYFTLLFAPLMPCIIINIAHLFEKRLYIVKTIPLLFVYAYAVAYSLYACFSSYTMFVNKMTAGVLPVFLVVYLNEKIQIRIKDGLHHV